MVTKNGKEYVHAPPMIRADNTPICQITDQQRQLMTFAALRHVLHSHTLRAQVFHMSCNLLKKQFEWAYVLYIPIQVPAFPMLSFSDADDDERNLTFLESILKLIAENESRC